MNIIFTLNSSVAALAFFVYGFSFEPVICSIIYSFVTSTVANKIRQKVKEQVRFDIITENADGICTEITENLKGSATVVDAHGAFSGAEKKMVICIIAPESVPKLEVVLKKYPDAVAFESMVNTSLQKASETKVGDSTP